MSDTDFKESPASKQYSSADQDTINTDILVFYIWSTQNKRWMKMNLVHFCDKEFHVHLFCITVLWNLTIYHFKMITNSLFKGFYCLFLLVHTQIWDFLFFKL